MMVLRSWLCERGACGVTATLDSIARWNDGTCRGWAGRNMLARPESRNGLYKKEAQGEGSRAGPSAFPHAVARPSAEQHDRMPRLERHQQTRGRLALRRVARSLRHGFRCCPRTVHQTASSPTPRRACCDARLAHRQDRGPHEGRTRAGATKGQQSPTALDVEA